MEENRNCAPAGLPQMTSTNDGNIIRVTEQAMKLWIEITESEEKSELDNRSTNQTQSVRQSSPSEQERGALELLG